MNSAEQTALNGGRLESDERQDWIFKFADSAIHWPQADWQNQLVMVVGAVAVVDQRDRCRKPIYADRSAQGMGRFAMSRIIPVPVMTLSVTHIFDGEEVVTGGANGQTWVATFCDPGLAQIFVEYCQKHYYYALGVHNESPGLLPPADVPTGGPGPSQVA